VSNGKLFMTGPAHSAAGRRLVDITRAVIADMGGADNLSEAERQVVRRGATLAVACERLEESICNGGSSATEQAFMTASGGLSPYVILREASRALHGIARAKGGDTIADMAKQQPEELGQVTELLVKAGDLAARAISAGSAQSADLELYGMLADRCARTFQRIGLKRRPRDLNALSAFASDQTQTFSPLRASLAKDAQPRDERELVDTEVKELADE
jgi:hypothetical protein